MKVFYNWLFNKSKVMIALLLALVVLGGFYFTQMPKKSEPNMDIALTFIEMSFNGGEYASITDLNESVIEDKEEEIRQVSKLININTTIYVSHTMDYKVVMVLAYDTYLSPEEIQNQKTEVEDLFKYFNEPESISFAGFGDKTDMVYTITKKANVSDEEYESKLTSFQTELFDIYSVKNVVHNTGGIFFSEHGTAADVITVNFDADQDFTKLSDDFTEIVDKYSDDLSIHSVIDSIETVKEGISSVITNLLEAIFIVFFIVILILGFKNAIGAAIALPIIVLITILINNLLGFGLENMMIAGLILTIGLIVDNVIVITESISNELSNGSSILDATTTTVKKNALPVLASTLTTLAAFTPIIFMPGVSKQYLQTLSTTVIIALILSYIFAILITPIISKILMSKNYVKPKTVIKEAQFIKLSTLINKVIRRPIIVAVSCLVLFVCAMLLFVTNGNTQFFPVQEGDIIMIKYESSCEIQSCGFEMVEYTNAINEVLGDFDEIDEFVYSMYKDLPNIGQQDSISPGSSSGRYYINTKLNEYETEDFANKLEIALIEQTKDFGYVTVAPMLYTSADDTSFVFSSDNYTDLVEVNQIITDKLEGHDFIQNVSSNVVPNHNFIMFKTNAKYSVTITAKPITGESGTQIQQEILEELEDELNSYENVNNIATGLSEMNNKIMTTLISSFTIALVLIVLIGLVQFNGFKLPLIMFATIPLALTGALTFAVIFNQSLSMTSSLGIIALMGIVVNNAILLLDYIKKEREDGQSIDEACTRSVNRRIKPIIASNLTAIGGMIPLAVFGGLFFRPMAIMMIGGILANALLSLMLVPSLYKLLHKEKN